MKENGFETPFSFNIPNLHILHLTQPYSIRS